MSKVLTKHYYRLLHWKRRLVAKRPRAGRRRSARPGEAARPLLVFCLVVLVVLACSAALVALSRLLGGPAALPFLPG